jgi:hypothetical protein
MRQSADGWPAKAEGGGGWPLDAAHAGMLKGEVSPGERFNATRYQGVSSAREVPVASEHYHTMRKGSATIAAQMLRWNLPRLWKCVLDDYQYNEEAQEAHAA